MALVTIRDMLRDARANHYAVPAFDVSSYKMARAVLDGAEALNAPVILMGLRGDLTEEQSDHLSIDLHSLALGASVPVCTHLDHATDFNLIQKAIHQGYSSVMFDGSTLPLEENIAMTKRVTDYAHAYGVSVEAELGHVGDGIVGQSEAVARGDAGHESKLTDPYEMIRFIDETKVDCLAVSIGTSHGVYKCEPHLEMPLLRSLNAASSVPLVMHGGSGTPDDQMREAVALGISKVNIFSEILNAYYTEMRDFLNSQRNLSLWTMTAEQSAMRKLTEKVEEKILLLNANGKA